MSYTAWSVVFGEQPTAAKWNQLGANDAGFKDGTNIDNLAILTRHLNTSAATSSKVKLSVINFVDPSGSNFTTTSASYVDITGVTTSYTSGATAERLFIWFQGMATNSAVASGQITLNINGTDQTEISLYKDDATQWDSFSKLYIYDVAASTTITIKGRAQNSGGSTLSFHRGSPYLASIRGFAISNV